MFELHKVGLDVSHSGSFFIDRPTGSGDRLLIIFKSEAVLEAEGRTMIVPPDSAIIFEKDQPQIYRASQSMYVNHFLHFDCAEEDLVGAVCGRLLIPARIAECEELLRMISREQLSASVHRDRYISMLISMLLLKVSEQDMRDAEPINAHKAALDRLRADMYSNPAQFRNVAELAAAVNLSKSHFQQLYKTLFGLPCYEDLLRARIMTAQYYLASTDLTVKEIAGLCGYDNDICFMHRFRARTGLTPCEYRSRDVQ